MIDPESIGVSGSGRVGSGSRSNVGARFRGYSADWTELWPLRFETVAVDRVGVGLSRVMSERR
jgi:hypothetical protein